MEVFEDLKMATPSVLQMRDRFAGRDRKDACRRYSSPS